MGRFTHSVVGVVGLLAGLLHHVCPLVVIPNIPMYNLPTGLSGLQFESGSGIPVSGKTYISTSSALNHGGSSYRAQIVRPSYIVGNQRVGYQRNPNVYTFTPRRSPMRSRISYTSIPTASTYRVINRSYQPGTVRQPITHYVQTIRGSRGSIVPQRRTPAISFPTHLTTRRTGILPVRTRIAAQTIRSSTVGQQPRTRPIFIQPPTVRQQQRTSPNFIRPPGVSQQQRTSPTFQPPSRVRAVSAGSSRVGVASKEPYVKKSYVKKSYVEVPKVKTPYVKKSKGLRGPTVKKHKTTSKRKYKSKSKTSRSRTSKSKRKAALKAKLRALKAKRKYKSKKNKIVG